MESNVAASEDGRVEANHSKIKNKITFTHSYGMYNGCSVDL